MQVQVIVIIIEKMTILNYYSNQINCTDQDESQNIEFVPLPPSIMVKPNEPTSTSTCHKAIVSVRPLKFQGKEGPDSARGSL